MGLTVFAKMPKRHASSDSSASKHEDLRFNLSLDTSELFASNPILENRFYEDKTAKTAEYLATWPARISRSEHWASNPILENRSYEDKQKKGRIRSHMAFQNFALL